MVTPAEAGRGQGPHIVDLRRGYAVVRRDGKRLFTETPHRAARFLENKIASLSLGRNIFKAIGYLGLFAGGAIAAEGALGGGGADILAGVVVAGITVLTTASASERYLNEIGSAEAGLEDFPEPEDSILVPSLSQLPIR